MGNLLLQKESRKTRTRFAIELEEAHQETGDIRFLKASKLLMSELKDGRRPVDDTEALYRMAQLLTTKAVRSPWAAARKVAAGNPGHSAKATAARLHRKYGEHGKYYRDTLSSFYLEERMTRLLDQLKPSAADFERIPELFGPDSPYPKLMDALAHSRSMLDLNLLLGQLVPGLSPEDLKLIRVKR